MIPLDRLDDYMAGWRELREATETAGGRAWLYRGTGHQDHFIEFLEWREDTDDTDLPERDPVAAARLELDQAFGSGHVDDWEEAPLARDAT